MNPFQREFGSARHVGVDFQFEMQRNSSPLHRLDGRQGFPVNVRDDAERVWELASPGRPVPAFQRNSACVLTSTYRRLCIRAEVAGPVMFRR